MAEETNKQLIARLRAKGRALGIGKQSKADRLTAKIAGQPSPTGKRTFAPNKNIFLPGANFKRQKAVRCLDTGEVFVSAAMAAATLGLRSSSLCNAFGKSKLVPRVARLRGMRFVYVAEAEAAERAIKLSADNAA